jgi:hypothetical protein
VAAAGRWKRFLPLGHQVEVSPGVEVPFRSNFQMGKEIFGRFVSANGRKSAINRAIDGSTCPS